MKPRGFSPLTACQIVKKVVTKPRANRGAVPSKSNRIAHKVVFSSIRAAQESRPLFDSLDSPACIAQENHLDAPLGAHETHLLLIETQKTLSKNLALFGLIAH